MSGYTYSNKNNRRHHYRKCAQKIADKHREENNKIREEHKSNKTKTRNNKNYNCNYSEVVMTCTDYKKLILEVPIKFTVFGKLTKNSKQLIFNLMNANKEWVNYNKDFYEYTTREIEFSDIYKFINNISKHKNKLKNVYEDCEFYSYFVYKYKASKNGKSDWFFGINLGKIYSSFITYNFQKFDRLPACIQINPLIYKNVKPEKFNTYPKNNRLGFFNTCSGGSKYIPEIEHNYAYRVYIKEKNKFDKFREAPKELINLLTIDYFNIVSIKKIRINTAK